MALFCELLEVFCYQEVLLPSDGAQVQEVVKVQVVPVLVVSAGMEQQLH